VTRWTWHDEKAALNRRKHRVSFDFAQTVFEDPFILTVPDPHPDGDRWRSFGKPSEASDLVLVVVHTMPERGGDDEVGRIISARKATRAERRRYEEGQP
jgi:uncharacterized DUF497 family protein